MNRLISRFAVVILFFAAHVVFGADYSLPGHVAVLPVAFVPRDEQPPTAKQKEQFLKHIVWAQQRYQELLSGDTFQISGKDVQIVRGEGPVDFYRKAPENGAPAVVAELLKHYQRTRFNCPYVFCILLINSKDAFPSAGGRPINGGLNSGGGMMYVSSSELKHNEHFQCTLQHELGHSFGLPHVDVYGYDVTSNASIMSYNLEHFNKGFEPSATPGVLIPEDLRALALNDRVFTKTTFDPARDVPSIYPLFKKIVPFGPMQLPGHPEFYPQITTTSGAEMGSKVGNIVREEIKPSAGPGVTYDGSTMWHSSRNLPGGTATFDLTFPMPVRLTAIGIHSQHSGSDHQATAMGIETTDGGIRRKVADVPVKSVDDVISFAPAEATTWSLTVTADKSKTLVIRGLQFFDGDQEIFPHLVPYRNKPETLAAQPGTAEAKPAGVGAPVAARLPVPEMAAQQEARKTVKQTYRTDYAKAKKPEAKVDLARTLMIQAAQTDKDAAHYALLTEASELAVAGGSLEIAFEAVQSLAGLFEVDALALKERVAAKMNPAALPSDPSAVLEKLTELANEAVVADEYALAAKIMQTAADIFRKPDHKPLHDQAVADAKQFAAMRDMFEAAKASREKLKTDPENAAANLTWGKFLCFFRQDWEGGLPLVAKGNDKVWAPLAERDLHPPKDAIGLLQLGDDWIKVGEREKEPVKTGTRLRANQTWAAALAGAPAAVKLDVEQKLDSRLVKLFGPTYSNSSGDADGVEIPGTERYSPGDQFTIEFWVSTTATSGTLLSKKHNATDMTFLTHLGDGAVELSFATPGERGTLGGPVVNDGRWHHIAIVKKADAVKQYVNGQEVHSWNESKPLISTSPWKFGCSHQRPAIAARFGGVRISNTARYSGSFTPQWLNPKDRQTLFP